MPRNSELDRLIVGQESDTRECRSPRRRRTTPDEQVEDEFVEIKDDEIEEEDFVEEDQENLCDQDFE